MVLSPHIALTMALALAGCVTLASVPTAVQAQPASRACFGTLRATPGRVHVGGALTLRGAHFTCTSPDGKLLPTASVFFYRLDLGFHIFSVHVRANGTYLQTVRVPAKLLPVSAVNGGSQQRVATRAGTYYLSIRLFDVALDPVKLALAHVRVAP